MYVFAVVRKLQRWFIGEKHIKLKDRSQMAAVLILWRI